MNLRCRLQGQGWEWLRGRILGALKGDDLIPRVCCPREWPEGWETGGSDPCHPSDDSAIHLSYREGDLETPKL